MKLKFALLALFLAAAMFSPSILAQGSGYHPSLDDSFLVSLGAFRSSNSFKISAEGQEIDPFDGNGEIDFGDSVGVSDSSTLLNAQMRWKFGKEKKWSVWGQYFSNDATGDATLTEDVEFEGIIFREGTFVEAGVKLEIIRLFFGRSFIKNEQHDFGAGIGVHNLDLGAFIGGEIMVDDDTTGYEKAEVGGSQILPNIGAWYDFSPAKKWLLHGRVDWISANINDYDGTMWNFNAGVNFQPWRHVGIDLSYQYFNLNLDVTKSDWRGGVDMKYSGPVLSLTANW